MWLDTVMRSRNASGQGSYGSRLPIGDQSAGEIC